MRISGLLLFLFLILILSSTSAQDPKPPVIINDYIETIWGSSESINVLSNDIIQNYHPVIITFLEQTYSYTTTKLDSMVFLEPIGPSFYSNFPVIDSIKYVIFDQVNMLASEPGYIIVTINELDFNMTKDTLSIGNVETKFTPWGNYFTDFFGDYKSAFVVPKNSGRSTIFDSYLILGSNEMGYTYMSASAATNNQYNAPVSDFWPGPKGDPYSYSIEGDAQWNRVWKISRADIQKHLNQYNDPAYEMPEVIAEWPVYGDTSKGQAAQIARFVDSNKNGIYDPHAGDYPWFEGDEAIFSVYNDMRLVNLASKGKQIGVDVQQYAYAFDCVDDSAFHNTIFISYTIINRSERSYSNFYSGIATIFRLGPDHDDYFGCDSALSSYFVYNDDVDEEFGYIPNYGVHPPAQAVCFLNPSLSSFIRHDFLQYFYSMDNLKGLWTNGLPIFYGENGHEGSYITKYLFSGNPSNPEAWSEIAATPESKGTKRGLGATGPILFESGDTIQLDIAYVFARDYNGTNLSSVDLMKERIERIQWFYDNDSTPCGTPWSGQIESKILDQAMGIILTPNPCNEVLQIQLDHLCCNQIASYSILNINGQTEKKGFLQSSNDVIAVNTLAAGMYVLKIEIENQQFLQKFIKK